MGGRLKKRRCQGIQGRDAGRSQLMEKKVKTPENQSELSDVFTRESYNRTSQKAGLKKCDWAGLERKSPSWGGAMQGNRRRSDGVVVVKIETIELSIR